MAIHKSLLELIGNTPLVSLEKLKNEEKLSANILAKVEYFNPGGSVKDRAALYMIEDAEKKGLLKEGSTIIEPTSGNTGVGLALVAAIKGYKLIVTMPETMSLERRLIMSARGAQIVLTNGAEGIAGTVKKAQELNKSIPNSLIMMQFSNEANIQAHEETTAQEILKDTEGDVDIFVAGVGTGGTVSGVGKALKQYAKEHNKNIQIVAVEPAASPLLSGGQAGPHKIQGIGANFIPDNYKSEYIDEVIQVSNEDAFAQARRLPVLEGLLIGISSGAAIHAALQLAKREENKGKNIVVLLADNGERYLSTTLFSE